MEWILSKAITLLFWTDSICNINININISTNILNSSFSKDNDDNNVVYLFVSVLRRLTAHGLNGGGIFSSLFNVVIFRLCADSNGDSRIFNKPGAAGLSLVFPGE